MGSTCKWFDLGIRVDVDEWNNLDTELKQINYLKKRKFYNKVLEIEQGISILKAEKKFDELNVKKLIKGIIFREQIEELTKMQEQGDKIRQNKSVKMYVINYVKDMKNGVRLDHNGGQYCQGTLETWVTFKNIFVQFYQSNPFGWNDIDNFLVNRFLTYLTKNCRLAKSTAGKHLKKLKKIVKDAEKEKVHTNHIALSFFDRVVTIKESDKTTTTYLTIQEVNALQNMKLSGFEEKVRDLFLIGVYTGLRFSDYSKLNDMKIVTSPEGYKTITLEQEKTDDVVVIPVDVRLESILKKYKNNVPKVESQNLNRTIKVICKRLSRKVPSLAQKIPTRLTKKELDAEKKGKSVFEKCDDGRYLKPKWSMISSHTGRRTCCTLMSQAKKLSEEEMMSISGHHDSRTFRQYVKTSKTEMAEGIYKSCGGKLF